MMTKSEWFITSNHGKLGSMPSYGGCYSSANMTNYFNIINKCTFDHIARLYLLGVVVGTANICTRYLTMALGQSDSLRQPCNVD